MPEIKPEKVPDLTETEPKKPKREDPTKGMDNPRKITWILKKAQEDLATFFSEAPSDSISLSADLAYALNRIDTLTRARDYFAQDKSPHA